MIVCVRICSSSCGEDIEGISGDLRFPVSAGKVGELKTCEWTIVVPEAFRVKITFTDFVMKTTCCSCVHDFLEIRDGYMPNSTLIGRFCAKAEPKHVYSTKNALRLKFGSNFRTYKGNRFRLFYEAICGRHYTDLSGSFRSPGYPFPYKNNQNCIFTIEVPRGRIRVDFEIFSVQGRMPICLYDSLEVREIRYVQLLNSQEQTQSRYYCGNEKPPVIYSTRGSYLWFRFVSDASGAASGFVANYRTVSVGEGTCGGTLKDPSGFIYSLNYPFSFPAKQNCAWKIQVTQDTHVHLYFDTLFFGINSAGSCQNGFVEIYDGISVSSHKIGQYCGNVVPNKIISRTNQLLVKAVSINEQETGWFSLRYTSLVGSVCGSQKFTCINRECVENHLLCDGNKDCKDGSDENNCQDTQENGFLSWYRFWPVSVVGGMLIVGIWLCRVWKKVLSTRLEVDGHHTLSHSPVHIAIQPHSDVNEPPSYSEAVEQDHRPPPSYEEVVRDRNLMQNTDSADSNGSTSVLGLSHGDTPQGSSVVVYNMVVSSDHGYPYDSHRSRKGSPEAQRV